MRRGRLAEGLAAGHEALDVGDVRTQPLGERPDEVAPRTVVGDGALAPAWAWRDSAGRASMHGVATAAVHASYLHLHPAAIPEALCRFVSRSAESGRVPTPQSVGDAPGAS